MTSPDIRWKQRFDNYRNALKRLTVAVRTIENAYDMGDEIDDLLREGLIQRFEYTHELAWKVMKDYAEYQGYTEIHGSRDAMRKALEMELIDCSDWLRTIEARNLTSHSYDEDTVAEIYDTIVGVYYPLFLEFEQTMSILSQAHS